MHNTENTVRLVILYAIDGAVRGVLRGGDMRLVSKSWTVAFVVLAAAGCTGSNQVDLQKVETTNVHEIPRFTEADAVSTLQAAASDQRPVTNAVEVIRSKVDHRFSWTAFWNLLEKASFYERLPTTDREAIWSLADTYCSGNNDTYDAFVVNLLRVPRDVPRLFEPKESARRATVCVGAVSAVTWSRVLKITDAVFESGDPLRGVDFLTWSRTQILENGDANERERRIDAFANEKVFRLLTLKHVVEKAAREDLQATLDWIELVDGRNDLPVFADAIVTGILTDHKTNPEAVSKAVTQQGFRTITRLFTLASRDTVLANRDPIFPALQEAYREETVRSTVSTDDALKTGSAYRALIESLEDLRRLESTTYGEIGNAERQAWLVALHRSLEQALWKNDAVALDVLGEALHDHNSPDVQWMKFRVLRHFGQPVAGIKFPPHAALQSAPLDELLWSRLKIHYAETETDMQKAIDSHCRLLQSRFGIVGQFSDPRYRELSVAAVEANPAQLLLPGCHTVRIVPGKTTFDRENQFQIPEKGVNLDRAPQTFVMNPDAIVRAPGLKFEFSITSMDGSIWDVSTDQVFQPEPVPSKPGTHDASLFPIVVGLKTGTTNAEFFAMHFVYRSSKSGHDFYKEYGGDHYLLDGIPSGRFSAKVTDASSSVPPTVIARPGAGQKWESKPFEGGRGSASLIDYDTLIVNAAWFSGLRGRVVDEVSGRKIVSVFPGTQWDTQALIDRAGLALSESEAMSIYIDPLFVGALDIETRKVIFEAQLDYLKQPHVGPQDALDREFARYLERTALDTLLSEVKKFKPTDNLRRFRWTGESVMEDAGKESFVSSAQGAEGVRFSPEFYGFFGVPK